MEWPQALQDLIEQQDLKPIDLFEITNQVDDWDSKFRSTSDTATKLPNGNFYYQVRVVLKDGRLGDKVREVWEGTQGLTKINYRNLNETSLKKQLYKQYIDDKGRLFVERIKSYKVSYQKNSKKVACVSF